LYNTIEEIQTENEHLKQLLQTYPQPEYILELIFNILLYFSKIPAKSEEGKSLWDDLIEIKT